MDLRELFYDFVRWGFSSGKQHNRLSGYSTPQKYGQMETFLTAQRCWSLPSRAFQGHFSWDQEIWSAGVARSISMFAPASLFIGLSTTLSRLSIILPACSNGVNPHRKDVQRFRRNPRPASQFQVFLQCDLCACAQRGFFQSPHRPGHLTCGCWWQYI